MKESRGDGHHAAIILPRRFGKVSKLFTEVCMMDVVDASCDFSGSCSVSVDFCTEQKSGLRHVNVDAVAKN